MREDDMLRLSLECARIAVRGDDYAPFLADGVHRIMEADAGVGVTALPISTVDPGEVKVVVAGAPPLSRQRIAEALSRIDRHPTLSRPDWPMHGTHRVSDHANLPAFWDTDVWFYCHGHSNGRYAAATPLLAVADSLVWVGVHRSRRDFDSADMDVLDAIRGPLGPALAFRHAWDTASRRLIERSAQGRTTDELTAREEQVLALVEYGWTNRRIGHSLGLSERTVRKHLENINAKLEVTNRTAAVARWKSFSLR